MVPMFSLTVPTQIWTRNHIALVWILEVAKFSLSSFSGRSRLADLTRGLKVCENDDVTFGLRTTPTRTRNDGPLSNPGIWTAFHFYHFWTLSICWFDKVLKVSRKWWFSCFSVSVPTLIWIRNDKVSGEILKVGTISTFYDFWDALDLLSWQGF